MHVQHKTAYALKNGQLTHISNVSRGLACGCICVECKGQLIAKKGSEKVHHFAHEADSNCIGAAETALHLLCKELFKELNSIVLPQYNFSKERKLKRNYHVITHEKIVVKGGEASITRTFIEQAEERFKPDITLESNSKKLFVEIAVTHKVDRNKLRHIRKCGFPAIEIHLDLADALLSRDELRNKLQTDLTSKRWLFHPKQREAERIFFGKIRDAIRISRRPAMETQSNISISPKVHLAYPNGSATGHYSNTELDRMRFEFYLKYKRQATSEEDSNLRAILYGNRVKNESSGPSYASIKGKRE